VTGTPVSTSASSAAAVTLPSEPFTRPRPAPRPAPALVRRLSGGRVRLTVRRVDPWSVFVMSLLLTLFLAVMTVVAGLVLYVVLEALGVPESINNNVNDVKGGGDVITFGRFVGVSALVAAANVVFLTGMATLGAVLYNLCATFAGGVDLTITEDD
jgi:hypothetical protein